MMKSAIALKFAVLVLSMFSLSGVAALRIIEPGNKVELAQNEGLIALVTDSEMGSFDLLVKRSGDLTSQIIANRESGLALTLIAAPIGNYRFYQIKAPFGHYEMPDEAAMRFSIHPNTIVYPGELQIRSHLGREHIVSPGVSYRWPVTSFHVVNRGLRTHFGLQKLFPGLLEQFQLQYGGSFPDPFLDSLPNKLDLPEYQAGSARKDATLTTASQSIETKLLYQRGGTEMARLSPNGQWIARVETQLPKPPAKSSTNEKDLEKKYVDQIQLLDAVTGEIKRVLIEVQAGAFNDGLEIDWADNRTILLTQYYPGDVTVAAIGPIDSAKELQVRQMPGSGWVVDALPELPNQFIYARAGGPLAGLNLYHIQLDGFKSLQRLKNSWRVPRRLRNDWGWLTDAQGRLRAAIRNKNGYNTIMYSPGNDKWKEAMQFPEASELSLVGFGESEQQVYLLTNHQRENIELVQLDLKSGAMQTKMAVAGVDLSHAIKLGRRVIGARFRQSGTLRAIYLNNDLTQAQTAVDKQLQSILTAHYRLHLLQESPSAALYIAESSVGTYRYVVHTNNGWRVVGVSQAWLDDLAFASTTTLQVSSADGMKIQGFLTAPAGAGPFPVVLMPHGGPIAVSDNADFDPFVQFWALRGYAVVRANYRGSSGFGKSFMASGKGQWGKLIESDIALVLDEALKDKRLDAGRVGIWGASYGGYSALITALKNPTRFSCVVSVAGVTDLPLLFTSSDWAQNPDAVKEMLEIVGDPKQSLAELKAQSPVYQVENFQGSALLFHGSADRRVATEHSERFLVMARLHGKDVRAKFLADEDHNLTNLGSLITVQDGWAKFFDQCLNVKTRAAAKSP